MVQHSTHKLKDGGLIPDPDKGRDIFIFRGEIGIGLICIYLCIFLFLVYAPGSTVVQHSTHKLKDEGLNPAPDTGREKIRFLLSEGR